MVASAPAAGRRISAAAASGTPAASFSGAVLGASGTVRVVDGGLVGGGMGGAGRPARPRPAGGVGPAAAHGDPTSPARHVETRPAGYRRGRAIEEAAVGWRSQDGSGRRPPPGSGPASGARDRIAVGGNAGAERRLSGAGGRARAGGFRSSPRPGRRGMGTRAAAGSVDRGKRRDRVALFPEQRGVGGDAAGDDARFGGADGGPPHAPGAGAAGALARWRRSDARTLFGSVARHGPQRRAVDGAGPARLAGGGISGAGAGLRFRLRLAGGVGGRTGRAAGVVPR